MIKFFRNIRQSLIKEGKTTNYLKYAIGEIVLVVIGILIALQINNWNTKRLEKIEEIELLIKLQSEFETNQENLKFILKEQENVIENLRYLLSHTGPNPIIMPDDSLTICMVTLAYLPKYVPKKGILTSAISSGKIAAITNDSLSARLSQWPGELEFYNFAQSVLYDLTKNQILELTSELYPIRNAEIENRVPEQNEGINSIKIKKGKSNIGKSRFSYNQNRILSSIELENYADLKRIDSEISLVVLNSIKIFQNEILRLIENELNEYD
jgi:hypothetical protein